MICNIVFMFHNEYFDNDFFSGFSSFKNKIGYENYWIANTRMVFTYFIYHAIILVFSLFQYCGSLVPVAKIAHRGLIFFKLPFLVGFYFLSYVFPNDSMRNF